MIITVATAVIMGELRPAPASPVHPPADDTAALQRLLAWLSPSFPVGAYSYSHGLEWAIEDGTVDSAATLEVWLTDILRHGGGCSDGIFLVHAWRAAASGDVAALDEVAELSVAFQPSRERHLETTAQGRAFLSVVAAAWPEPHLSRLIAALGAEASIAYPVAIAIAAAAHEVPLAETLTGYLSAFAANLVSAGVRAVPVGHTDGQRVIAALVPVVAEMARHALAATLDEVSGAAIRADIASMKHETQYTRLFRS